MFSRITNALRWVKAIDLTSSGEFAKARRELARIDLRRKTIARHEFHLLEAYVLMRLRAPEAKRAVANALTAIDELSGMGDDERIYLRTYAQFIVARIYRSSGQIEVDRFDITSVPRRTLDLFPLPQHPDWK